MTDILTYDEREMIAKFCGKTIVQARSWDKGGVWIEQKDGGEATATLNGRDTASEPWEPDEDATQRDELLEAAMRLGWDVEQYAINGVYTARVYDDADEAFRSEVCKAPGLALCQAFLRAIIANPSPTSAEKAASPARNDRRTATS